MYSDLMNRSVNFNGKKLKKCVTKSNINCLEKFSRIRTLRFDKCSKKYKNENVKRKKYNDRYAPKTV